eukprot:TRINITY_DN11221_c0_g1_i2.p2 TRINITY_DN11221_c0_g1~~TRINITY_DN11221_c0_g1_i2.p2  ORF type:complete len:422 (+),score=31.14 TRINITY_DN11221_c0_g1_i2:2307-3572(+)
MRKLMRDDITLSMCLFSKQSSSHHYLFISMMLTSVELVLALSSLSLQALALCDVIDYGAVGDGLTNDTEAIHASIQDCMKPGKSRDVYFPAAHNFATWPLRFEGSQWANFTLTFDGNLTNMALPSSWPSDRPALISFVSVANVTIQGQGWLLGKGQAWWQIRRATPSAFAPRIIEFDHSSKLVVTDISLLNSPIWNLKFDNCIDVSVSNITIVAPFDSPNTDGIDLDSCHFATVDGVRISNGDDEVAIGGSSSNILVQNSLFANGHGASIGSIGENNGTGITPACLIFSDSVLAISTVQDSSAILHFAISASPIQPMSPGSKHGKVVMVLSRISHTTASRPPTHATRSTSRNSIAHIASMQPHARTTQQLLPFRTLCSATFEAATWMRTPASYFAQIVCPVKISCWTMFIFKALWANHRQQ